MESILGKRGDVFFWLALISIIAGGWLFFAVGIWIGLVSTIILLALVMVIGHMDAQGEDQYRFRDRLSGLRKAFEVRRPLIVMFVGLFIFLPNTFYGYDAGVPFEDKKDHDVAVYDFLSYDFLRPDEYMNDEKTNTSLYRPESPECTTRPIISSGTWVTLDLPSLQTIGLRGWDGYLNRIPI
jgi:hypothetical protein